jgi:hypothetical protein
LTVTIWSISAILKKYFFDSFGRKAKAILFKKYLNYEIGRKLTDIQQNQNKQPYWISLPSLEIVKSLQVDLNINLKELSKMGSHVKIG